MRNPLLAAPSSDFNAVRDGRRTQPFYVDVDLGTARSLAAGTALVLPIAGNSIYIDPAQQSGFATLHVQDQAALRPTPLTVYPGFIARLPFTFLAVENEAQPGMILRIVYGVDVDFVPSTAAGVSLLTPVSIADAINPTCAIEVTALPTAIGAAQVNAILLPAANPRGIRFKQLLLAATAGAGGTVSSWIIAAATAPTGVADKANAIILASVASANLVTARAELYQLNRTIPPSWGVWNVCDIATAVATGHGSHLSVEVL